MKMLFTNEQLWLCGTPAEIGGYINTFSKELLHAPLPQLLKMLVN